MGWAGAEMEGRRVREASSRPRDLTLTGGRRRRNYAVAIWATVVVFTIVVLIGVWI